MASDDDTFTGGVAGHVRRIAERREACYVMRSHVWGEL